MPKYSGNDYELRIGRAKMEDKGEYVVKAVNSFGSKEECAVLSVERKSFILQIIFILILYSLNIYFCSDLMMKMCLHFYGYSIFNVDIHTTNTFIADTPTKKSTKQFFSTTERRLPPDYVEFALYCY